MDVTQLRYFLKTAELLNYTRASEALFITRQSLRQAIGAMEAEIGKPLFVNVRNKLSLTEYGAYLAVSGAEAVRAFDRMSEGMQRLVNRQTTLRIAFSVSLFPFILPDADLIVRTFRAQFPAIHLEVSQMRNDEVILAAQRGDIDAGCVIQMPCRREGCAMQVMNRFDAAIDVGSNSPLLGRPRVTLDDLDGLPCIGMGSLETTMRPVHEACMTRGITLAYQPISSTIDAFYHIEHGHAVGFDILTPQAPNYDPKRMIPLEGYSFEIGFLRSGRCENASALELFCSYFVKASLERWDSRLKA